MKAVNLVPADARRRGASLATGLPFLGLVGGLVLVLIATLLFVTEHNRVDSRKAQLAGVQVSAARWTAAAGTYGHDVAVSTARQSAIAKVESLAGSRYDWSVLLGRLGDAMPRESVLSSLAITASSASSASSTTGSSSTPATSGNATSIALAACATSQSVVAQTMVNLRRIAGVSQVILSSSGAAGTGGTNTGGCPYRVSFALTVPCAPPPAPPSAATGATAPAASDPSSISSSTGVAQ